MLPQLPLADEFKSIAILILIAFAIMQTLRRRPEGARRQRDDTTQRIFLGVAFSAVGMVLTIVTFVTDGQREAYLVSVSACVLGAAFAGLTFSDSRR